MGSDGRVQAYSVGICCASVCAPADAGREEIEREVNARHPTGLDHGWHIADEPFRTGEPNPCPCNHDASRQHWLLVC